MKNKKGNIVVITLIIIIVAITTGIIGYLFAKKTQIPAVEPMKVFPAVNQSTQPTRETPAVKKEISDWKKYESQNYRYSLRFPSYLYHKGNRVQSTPGFFAAQDLVISDIENMAVQDVLPNENIHITINVDQKSSDESLYDHIKKRRILDDAITEINFNKTKSYRIKSSTEQMKSISIFTSNGNVVYHLAGMNYLGENDESSNYKLMQQIIDTFEIIK